jgi:hypothetical protein
VIALERMTLDDAVRLIETGEIKDGKSIAGLLLARKRTGGASTGGNAGTIVNP